ncbi:regulatory protein GemA [Rhizobium phage RR1-B]|uniref:regulatory protein GemA n=1 Tax=Rhizobium phage RR1-B TaxID=929834 RepID=UPI0003426955|nr:MULTISPECIES: regulatory protein GemA [Rhizobium/Agrobacterium group]YP_008129831.1 regulatory protein GemA [Rhizobium phage RR1-B]AGN38686.1 hypothetical protein RHYG_00017 [Rhizobium phage RR1-B]CAD7023066.1 regulatory protein GemA [Rhizobium sp. P007]HAU74375.1 regulatory protein GemA [Agrobacterium sp.]
MNTIAIINVAKSQLEMEETEYRALLVRVAGIASLRAMSERQRIDVVDEFKRLGFKVLPGKSAKGKLEKHRPTANRPWSRYIHALWKSCARLGVIDDASVKALNAFCKRFISSEETNVVVDVDFLSQAQAEPIVSALKSMERRGKAGKI